MPGGKFSNALGELNFKQCQQNGGQHTQEERETEKGEVPACTHRGKYGEF